MKKFLIGALLLIVTFTSCQYKADKDYGNVRIAVVETKDQVATYGLESADMVTSYYKVTIRNTEKSISYDTFRVEKTGADTVMEVASGMTSVTVDAYNGADIRIGSGTATVNVLPMKENPVKVTVREENITSERVTVMIKTAATSVDGIRAEFRHRGEGQDYTITQFSRTEGGFKGEVRNVQNGYYVFYLKDATHNLQSPMAIRIGAGQSLTITVDIEDNWKITVSIDDQITATPEIKINGGKTSYEKGEAYSLTATIRGLDGGKISWWLDGEELSQKTSKTLTGNIPQDMKPGTHSFTCMAEKGGVVWSERHEFSVVR